MTPLHADVLSDETARKLYDEYGAEGMKSHEGGASGKGNSDRLWDEFKPFKRENRRTRARSAARYETKRLKFTMLHVQSLSAHCSA